MIYQEGVGGLGNRNSGLTPFLAGLDCVHFEGGLRVQLIERTCLRS